MSIISEANRPYGADIDEVALDTAVSRFLSSSPYHACLLLVHPEIAWLHAATRYLQRFNWPQLPLNQLLSEALLPVAPRQRGRETEAFMRREVKRLAPGPILLTDIDLLFEPSLSLDPLVMLRQLSRRATWVVTWPGTYAGGVLAYAVAEHAHYRTWDAPDLCDHCIVAL